ncbi:MAG: hypothetical protein IJW74_03245, partial [Oscillospiraceae bacterium]|nr:hypothetical protein [Oscillospiraceae bacterium]
MVIKYKASNLIEDFNLNAKTTLTELTELFGTEIKKGTVLTETQCNIAFEHYTKQAKTVDFANYLGKKAEKPAVKEEAKKAAPKTEKPAAKKPMQEKPKADRPAPKAENKPAEKQQPKADKKPVPKQEQPKQQPKNNEPLKRADGTIVEVRQPKQKTEKQAPAVKQEFVTVTVDTR